MKNVYSEIKRMIKLIRIAMATSWDGQGTYKIV